MRLTQVSVRGLAGLPDLELSLLPMTALIGPRASGKSRLLAAISWLLTGEPQVRGRRASRPFVSAELMAGGTVRTIARGENAEPSGPLPPVTYLKARGRLTRTARSARLGSSDAAVAEAAVETIAERRLAGVENEILLIEEPELMLNPQQQRHFYALLRRFAERNQVIYSTRAPAMLDAVHYHEIVRLDISAGPTAVRRAAAGLLTEEQMVRLEAEFDHERTEMFFATSVVLVEGQTERLALPLIFRALGHDVDALGISIVEVGGKGNLVLVARVLAELGIPHVVVFDSDRGGTAQRENALIRKAVRPAPTFQLDPDFEGIAGIREHDEKVLAAWRRFSRIAPGRIPRILRHIVETTVALANGGA
jgi:predicted ATP-dependent endonuclease of OLD family